MRSESQPPTYNFIRRHTEVCATIPKLLSFMLNAMTYDFTIISEYTDLYELSLKE
jgi:hypothetical protein